jgi:hypothetical protein
MSMQEDYPEFNDPETCSWCFTVCENDDLNDMGDGSRVCDSCADDYINPSDLIVWC